MSMLVHEHYLKEYISAKKFFVIYKISIYVVKQYGAKMHNVTFYYRLRLGIINAHKF